MIRRAATPVAGSGSLPARTAALTRNLRQRTRERPFWIIQAGVLSLTALHVLGEVWAEQLVPGVHPASHHIPVVLYLGPISYASLRYGTEGAVLTGLWSAALTIPNVALWHQQNFEWLTELAYVGIVVTVGGIMAIPVERERHERRRAEATSRRLALLNEIATLTLTADLRRTLDDTLARLVAVLGLDAACVAVTGPDEEESTLSVLACQSPGGPGAALANRFQGQSPATASQPMAFGDDVVTVPLPTDLPGSDADGRLSSLLAAQVDPARPLQGRDYQLLTAVGSQIGIALANARLQERERHRLRAYARLVTQAQEDERKRIARELHDEAAQNLVVIRRHLDALATTLDRHPAAADLTRLRELTGQTLAGLRRFSRDLRPPVLDDLGLVSALDALVADVRRRSKLTIELTVAGGPRRLPTETELALFRIGQAALHNVEHHAGANSVAVELTFAPQCVRLVISDDGRGFEPPENLDDLTHAGKLGLAGMNERARLVSGTLQITSAPGAGTRVSVETPGC